MGRKPSILQYWCLRLGRAKFRQQGSFIWKIFPGVIYPDPRYTERKREGSEYREERVELGEKEEKREGKGTGGDTFVKKTGCINQRYFLARNLFVDLLCSIVSRLIINRLIYNQINLWIYLID